MRTGGLSNERTIAFLNENFINTWVTNAELGRTVSLREPIARRREREGKTFDTNHALANAIMNGWKQGSPVDCFVISPDFELMASLDYNQFLDDVEDDEAAYQSMFLEGALEGKRPGLGDLILTPEHPSREVVDTFSAPAGGHQNDTVVFIDTTAFEKGGRLTIDIHVGRDKGIGIFYLFDGDKKLPREKQTDRTDTAAGNSQESDEYEKERYALTNVWGIFPDHTGRITYDFDSGQRFKLCATGDPWGGPGTINAFHAKVSVVGL